MAKRTKKTRKKAQPTPPEVQAVATILMGAVVLAIEDFESDQSFLLGMGSITDSDIPEDAMEEAASLRENLTRHLGGAPTLPWEPGADDLGTLTDLISEFDDQGLLKIKGSKKGPDVYVGWACNFAWFDGTTDESLALGSVCERVLDGKEVASTLEELEEVAAITGFSVAQDGQEFTVSRVESRKFPSVQAAAHAMLLDEELRGLPMVSDSEREL
jgi:hypothetical protein